MINARPNKRRWLRALFNWSLSIGLFVLMVSVGVLMLLRWWPVPTSAFMLQQRLAGQTIDYRWVGLEQISPHAILAVVASEDQNFFTHWGIDLKAIADAMEENQRRSRPRGASTISQQVAKNLFLWPGHSYLRKALELYVTLLMELCWPKARVMEVYLNIAEMGPGVFGVEAAGQRFFSKPASRLTAWESARLAAVLPSPKRMSAARPSDYVGRRTWAILQQMNALGGLPFLAGQGVGVR